MLHDIEKQGEHHRGNRKELKRDEHFCLFAPYGSSQETECFHVAEYAEHSRDTEKPHDSEGLQRRDRQRKEEVEDQIANLPDESNDGSDDTTGGGDDTTGGDTTPSTGEPTFDPGTGTITIPGYDAPIILPSYSPSGVLGVRTDASTDGVGGLQLDGIGDTGNDEKNELKINPIVKKNTVNKNRLGKKISDPAVPLAAIPDVEDDSVTMNWMWLLIIFLLGATGKKMYDEYRKKVEAEEAAKNKDK